ncbi:MAG: 50S ribosomal protein L11 methyltransferase, partial [Thermorudis peleae]|nr:50S ribosomal protein L11 methyltransferase [Thermorudis peleae]MBX6755357.1 50S ribosomal protein L11 methyltransferase [Thermorudis peleae]
SGIITEARDDVVQRYRHLGFTVRDQRQEGDWVTLLLQRNDDL